MQTATLFPVELLTPLSGELPAGANLRFAPEWKELEEAKREDDGLNKGDWAAKDQKVADWDAVDKAARGLLARTTKDLRLAIFLIEAVIRKHGYSALSDSFRFLQDFSSRFWHLGLHPERDGDSFEERAAALEWINEKLPDILQAQTITKRSDAGPDFTFSQYLDARAVGREKDYEEGKVSAEKRERFLKAKEEGRYLDPYYVAVALSSRSYYEEQAHHLDSALTELKALNKLLVDKFGSPEAAPGFSAARKTLEEIWAHIDTILDEKRREEPGPVKGEASTLASNVDTFAAMPLTAFGTHGSGSSSDWAKAEEIVRAGDIERGLAEMTLLAQRETSGRARFQRKLLLSDIAIRLSKNHLAQSILEELAEQIDTFRLVEWETTDVIGAVWVRLYRLYKRTGNDDRAQQLYQRLCRVDPWQAFACTED